MAMDKKGFRLFLKRMGKKDHVVEGLIDQVQAFEAYLAGMGLAGPEAAGESDLQAYVETLAPKAVKGRLRGLVRDGFDRRLERGRS
jgi:hypothetical protein